MQKQRISSLILGILIFFVMGLVNAGAPLWTLTPVAGFPPAANVDIAGSVTVKYTVTNQSHKVHQLVMVPIKGISSSGCTAPLGSHQSCTLTLQVNGEELLGNVEGGPVLCSGSSHIQCFQPSQSNSLNITVVMSQLSLNATPSTFLQVGAIYSQVNTVSRGIAPYVYSVSSGALPTGTSLNLSTGTVSGIPTMAQAFSYTIQVADTAGAIATAFTNGTIALLSLNATPSANLQVDVAYSQTNVASGGTPPYVYSISSGALPSGTSLNSSTGTVSGTPTMAENFSYTIQVADASGATATAPSNGTITELSLSATPSTNLVVGTAYSQTNVASGGVTPYAYSLSAGALPSGTSLNPSTGTVSGTLTTAENFSYTIEVADTAGATATAPSNGTITIDYTVGGFLSGLNSGNQITLQNNGGDDLVLNANGGFTFPSSISNGNPYSASISLQPAGQTCTIVDGSGTVSGANVTNIITSCYAVLHSFGPGDGQNPFLASLVEGADGNFYGTTQNGGANGQGTVFTITPSGIETVLHDFGSGSDGRNPYGGLVLGSDGDFYGTTRNGGTGGRGTVFKITPAGVETVLHSFGVLPDAQSPYAAPVEGPDGNFYGTTQFGGAHNLGTIYKITPAGTETVFHSFGSGADGDKPVSALIVGSDGDFYGTTRFGGGNNFGVVFKITLAGAETVLHSFGAVAGDGRNPFAALFEAPDGNFYGTTSSGGANNAGAVFKITSSGTETVLHSFGAGNDGQNSLSPLILGLDGNFYGTTNTGGVNGQGTIFKITPAGAEMVLHDFGSGADGRNPQAALLLGSDGSYYGVTFAGGASGSGSVFKF